MLLANPLAIDARVRREVAALHDADHQVMVVAKAGKDPAPAVDDVEVVPVHVGSGLKSTGSDWSVRHVAPLARVARWFLLPQHRVRTMRSWTDQARAVVAELEFDVVHSHDFPTLGLGHELAAARGVPLVYDSHELWSGRRRSGRRTPITHRRDRELERQLGSKAQAVITVSDGLASVLGSRFGWNHVTVVRNTFPLTPPASAPAVGTPTALVYAGRLAAGRDLATVAAASRCSELPVKLMGPRDETWMRTFDAGKCSLGPTTDIDGVDDELRAAGLSLVTLSDDCANHRVALPNKVFQAVRAGVPVIASDVGSLARLVREHGIGTLYRPGDRASLLAAIDLARSRYDTLLAGVAASRESLSWRSDRDRLLNVYRALG